jgi:mannan endo-1,4-beta-mannosidase
MIRRMGPGRAAVAGAAAVATAVAAVSIGLAGGRGSSGATHPAVLPRAHQAYLGVYTAPVPASYAGVAAFAAATGTTPRLVVYYSGWREPFKAAFAATVTRHGATPIVQIDPTDINVQQIANGRYDAYLRSYASAVKAFHRPVILSFGHEMNGYWYSWARHHTAPAVFVAAWRHIVTVFRQQDAANVTWLWTVNIIDKRGGIPSPAPWWPGSAYVNWVGMDGYYFKPSWTFASLFGPTIKAVRALTLDPVLITETAAPPAADQAEKIADLAAGVRAYGLLGFVWFNANKKEHWRLTGRPAHAAYGRAARSFQGNGS